MIGLIAARGWLALPDPCLVRPRNTVLDVAQPIDQHGLAALYWALAFTSSHRSLTGSPQITGQIRRSGHHRAGRIGSTGFDHGVLAVCSTSRYWGWWLPGTPPIPAAGMFVQVIEYFQPVFFS